MFVALIVACQTVTAKTPNREPKRVQELIKKFDERMGGRTSGVAMSMPFQLGPWKFDESAMREKEDTRNDLWQFGVRPTLVVMVDKYRASSLGPAKGKASKSELARRDELVAFLKEVDDLADDNEKKYDVLVITDIYQESDRAVFRKLFESIKSKHLDWGELGYQTSGYTDSAFYNYWSNYVCRPTAEMLTEDKGEPAPMGSWIWMPTVGTIDAWGVWGNKGEMSRLKSFVKAHKRNKLLDIRNKKHAAIMGELVYWNLGDAAKELEKLEKSDDDKDIEAAEKIREFESSLEQAYRDQIAGHHQKAGYLIEYADAMTVFAEESYTKRSKRGSEILDEIKEFKKSDEYEHVEDAKKEYEKLRESIYSQIGGNVHGDAYQEKWMKVMKKNQKKIEKFNEEYGDTPYAETTKKWQSDASAG